MGKVLMVGAAELEIENGEGRGRNEMERKLNGGVRIYILLSFVSQLCI